MQILLFFWIKIKKAIRARYWIARQALREIWRRIKSRREWGMLLPKIIWHEFIVPFFSGHIPHHLHVVAVDAGFLLKPTPVASVESIQAKVCISLADYALGPYERTGILPNYARILLDHYIKCNYCQAKTLQEYGELQRLAWMIHRENEQSSLQ